MISFSDIKNTAHNFVDSIDIHAPPQIKIWFWKIMEHPGTPWFFLGTGIEALGITIQYQFFEASYPILDFLVGFALFAYIVWWQQKQQIGVGGDDTDDGEDSGTDEETGEDD